LGGRRLGLPSAVARMELRGGGNSRDRANYPHHGFYAFTLLFVLAVPHRTIPKLVAVDDSVSSTKQKQATTTLGHLDPSA
jgi:hypothetical protein